MTFSLNSNSQIPKKLYQRLCPKGVKNIIPIVATASRTIKASKNNPPNIVKNIDSTLLAKIRKVLTVKIIVSIFSISNHLFDLLFIHTLFKFIL